MPIAQRRCALIGNLLMSLLVSASLGQTLPDPLQPLVGQKLILLHLGDLTETSIKKRDLATVEGNCDVAVLVRKASFDKGKARLDLEDIGTPSIAGVQNECRKIQIGFSLEITDFAPKDTPDSVSASVGQLLLTPEQYLVAHGIAFDLQPGPEHEKAISAKSPAKVDPPKLLLSIDPRFSEEARREKYQGVVTFRVIVGTDGRVHNAQVSFAAGRGLDEHALKVLSMWRFEPAHKSGEPVAIYVSLEINFHLH